MTPARNSLEKESRANTNRLLYIGQYAINVRMNCMKFSPIIISIHLSLAGLFSRFRQKNTTRAARVKLLRSFGRITSGALLVYDAVRRLRSDQESTDTKGVA